ncbi:hypothetical protein BN903_83 [Halorubrum sp. AJ67]|nr:hypothetical protein BN903_83 [Halorubrum sp. AJ67]
MDLKKDNHYIILSLPESYTTPLATHRFGVLLISRSCFGPLRPFYHGLEYNPSRVELSYLRGISRHIRSPSDPG